MSRFRLATLPEMLDYWSALAMADRLNAPSVFLSEHWSSAFETTQITAEILKVCTLPQIVI